MSNLALSALPILIKGNGLLKNVARNDSIPLDSVTLAVSSCFLQTAFLQSAQWQGKRKMESEEEENEYWQEEEEQQKNYRYLFWQHLGARPTN